MDKRLSKHDIGMAAEEAVRRIFIECKYIEVVRNYSVSRIGELDLVFRKGNTLCIIEVKSRKVNNNYGGALYAIGSLKRKRIYATARYLVAKYHLESYDIRFFAGCVTHDDSGYIQKVQIIPF